MNMNKTLLAAAMAFGVAMTAQAADQGHGKVTFKGSIIDAPCSVATDSIEQEVDFGQLSAASLSTLNGNSGQSQPKNFQINLENCGFGNPAKNNNVTVTYSGMADAKNAKLLGVTGTAKGIGIALTDGSGTQIELMKPTAPQPLQDGDNTLSFAAFVQNNGASTTVTEGDFSAITNFTLAYQ